MNLSPRIQTEIDGRLVEVGAQWNRPLAWPQLQVVATCDSTSPAAYHAEVRMGGHVLVRTGSTDDIYKAQRAATAAFEARLASLFTE